MEQLKSETKKRKVLGDITNKQQNLLNFNEKFENMSKNYKHQFETQELVPDYQKFLVQEQIEMCLFSGKHEKLSQEIHFKIVDQVMRIEDEKCLRGTDCIKAGDLKKFLKDG